MLNGQLLSAVIDDDAAHHITQGLLGAQVHIGPSMKESTIALRAAKADEAAPPVPVPERK